LPTSNSLDLQYQQHQQHQHSADVRSFGSSSSQSSAQGIRLVDAKLRRAALRAAGPGTGTAAAQVEEQHFRRHVHEGQLTAGAM
jgi:hypothetical protein